MAGRDDLERAQLIEEGGANPPKKGTALVNKMSGEMKKKESPFASPTFARNIELAARISCALALGSLCAYIPQIYESVPEDLRGFIPTGLMFATIYFSKNFALTLTNIRRALSGVGIALLNIWVVTSIFPGGVRQHHGWSDGVFIFGLIDFAALLVFFLYLNFSTTCMIVGTINHTLFMMQFQNPNNEANFWNFKQLTQGELKLGAGLMAITCCSIGGCLALLAMCIPYPIWATKQQNSTARDISHNIRKLFEITNDYYSGTHVANVVVDKIHYEVQNIKDEIGHMDTALTESWYECFNLGTRGQVRARLKVLSGVLKKLHELLYAMQIAASQETFSSVHQEMMSAIKDPLLELSVRSSELLESMTDAATEGALNQRDKAQFLSDISRVQQAAGALAEAFNTSRKKFSVGEAKQLSVSFFVYVCTSFSQLVTAEAEKFASDPAPKPESFGSICWVGFKTTWQLANPQRHMFVLRYASAIIIGYLIAIGLLDHSATVPITITILISDGIGYDIEIDLRRVQAVVIASVIPLQTHAWVCTGIPAPGNTIVCMICILLYSFTCAYIWYASSRYGFVGCLLLIVGITKWATPCDGSEVSGAAVYTGILHCVVGVLILIVIDVICMSKMPSQLCTESLIEAFNKTRVSLEHIFDPRLPVEDAPLDDIPALLDRASACNKYAATEPRFWKKKWNGPLIDNMCLCLREIHRDLKTLILAYPGDVHDIFLKVMDLAAYKNVKEDILTTLGDCSFLCAAVLMDKASNALAKLENTDHVDEIEDMPFLVKDMAKELSYPDKAPASLDEDKMCRTSAVLECLQDTVKAMGRIQHALAKEV